MRVCCRGELGRLARGRNPSFQYILTTTSAPPDEVNASPLLRLRLDVQAEKDMLIGYTSERAARVAGYHCGIVLAISQLNCLLQEGCAKAIHAQTVGIDQLLHLRL